MATQKQTKTQDSILDHLDEIDDALDEKETKGKITEKLVKLSLPIMATSFIQMAYNMIDMIWVGKAGSSSVAAVGTAGFFTWLAMAFITISKVGAEVKVAQSMGQHDVDETKLYIKSAIEINIILSILYTIFLIIL